MSPDELNLLVNNIIDNLRKDLVLETEFNNEYKRIKENRWQRIKLFLLKIMTATTIIRLSIISVSCIFPSNPVSKTLRLLCVDLLYELQSFGCLFNQIYLGGQLFVFFYLLIMRKHEITNQLNIISHLKHHRRFKFTTEERQKFAICLKLMKSLRTPALYLSVIPLIIFHVFGGVKTAFAVKSMNFTVASLFVILEMILINYYGIIVTLYGFLMIMHSSTYLTIRFNKLFNRMNKLHINTAIRYHRLAPVRGIRQKLMTWITMARFRTKMVYKVIPEVENVLTEVRLHNQTMKYIVQNCLSFTAPLLGFNIIFLAGNDHVLYKGLAVCTCVMFGFMLSITLFTGSQVYSLSKKLNILLHAIQVRDTTKDRAAKLHILRLIHRTSDCKTWNLPIGFTVGSQASFSPMTAISSIANSICIALTFLNSRSTWRRM